MNCLKRVSRTSSAAPLEMFCWIPCGSSSNACCFVALPSSEPRARLLRGEHGLEELPVGLAGRVDDHLLAHRERRVHPLRRLRQRGLGRAHHRDAPGERRVGQLEDRQAHGVELREARLHAFPHRPDLLGPRRRHVRDRRLIDAVQQELVALGLEARHQLGLLVQVTAACLEHGDARHDLRLDPDLDRRQQVECRPRSVRALEIQQRVLQRVDAAAIGAERHAPLIGGGLERVHGVPDVEQELGAPRPRLHVVVGLHVQVGAIERRPLLALAHQVDHAGAQRLVGTLLVRSALRDLHHEPALARRVGAADRAGGLGAQRAVERLGQRSGRDHAHVAVRGEHARRVIAPGHVLESLARVNARGGHASALVRRAVDEPDFGLGLPRLVERPGLRLGDALDGTRDARVERLDEGALLVLAPHVVQRRRPLLPEPMRQLEHQRASLEVLDERGLRQLGRAFVLALGAPPGTREVPHGDLLVPDPDERLVLGRATRERQRGQGEAEDR